MRFSSINFLPFEALTIWGVLKQEECCLFEKSAFTTLPTSYNNSVLHWLHTCSKHSEPIF